LTWQQLTLSVDSAEAERAEALLTLAGALALAFDDAGDDPVLEPPPGSTPLWPTVNIRALFPATLDLLPLSLVLQSSLRLRAPIAVQALGDDWRNAPKEIAPRPVGQRLWVAPAGSATPTPAGRVGIRLNMGLAFGTGAHPTTALCLEWLDANVVPGATLLDYGCGSGVLAVAALALGARRAWAVDNDRQALAATADNARLNGVEDKLWVGPPEALPSLGVDLAVANILAGPLERLAPALAAALIPQGRIALSGILNAQRDRILVAYEPYFLSLASAEREGWLLLHGHLGSSA
jgi:ribosomal protein L11 methyltransferase